MNTLILRVAFSLTIARWRQALVAAIGVTFGIAMFIGLLTFMMGLNEMLDNMILNRTPHIRLFNEIRPNINQPVTRSPEFSSGYNFIHSLRSANDRQEIYDAVVIQRILGTDERIVGVAPKITTQVFFNDGLIDRTGIINGIDVSKENELFHFNEYITNGNSADLDNLANTIILGSGLASSLRVIPGDKVYVTTPDGYRLTLRVSGIFQSGLQDFDKVQSFTSIRTAQKILNKGRSYITDLQVKIRDIEQAPVLSREFARRFRTDSEDIKTSNAEFETGSSIRTTISYAVGVTLLIVAGFGIFNILNMMIYEKMDSIAILKATGFSGKDVNSVFIVIALSIGLFGGILGLTFGFLLSSAIDRIPFETQSLPTITTYPVSYDPIFYMIGFLFSLVTTYFAGWLPARKAAAVDPVLIIRGK